MREVPDNPGFSDFIGEFLFHDFIDKSFYHCWCIIPPNRKDKNDMIRIGEEFLILNDKGIGGSPIFE